MCNGGGSTSQRIPAQRGFTLVELVMVLIILGILAVYAVPRMFSRSDFDARGLHDGTLAYLRYAQKTAVAQRRTVCAAIAGNAVSLRIATAAGTYGCTAGSVLNGPDGAAQLAGGRAVYGSVSSAAISFDALGQPVDSTGTALGKQTITVTGAGRIVTIEAATGYVHD